MHPVLFSIGVFNVYSYGLMVALGAAAASYLIYKRANHFNLDKNKAVDLIIMMLIGGLIGARLFHVIVNIQYYIARPLEIIDLTKGGLAWYGGFITGILTAVVYIKKNKMDFWLVTDLVAPYVALAQSFGRIGCFLNGCCYGSETDLAYPFGVIFPNTASPVHPTQVYSSLALLGIFVILRIVQDLPHFKGEVALGYCILYSSKRFVVEFWRADNPRIMLNLTIPQYISLAVFAVSMAIFIRRASQWRRYLSTK